MIELIVRQAPTPSWFVNSIPLTDGAVLVVVDDEGDAFSYWQKTLAERLSEIKLSADRQPTLIGLSGPEELRNDQHGALTRGTLFLIDYEFKEESTNGIELIEQLKLADKAILVTNYFEQSQVLEGVARLKLRLLPKLYMLNAKFPIDLGSDIRT